jgi:hypothetical protein
MARFFNTAGPCRPELHYMLPPERRLPDVERLIAEQQYFVVHAPRQVGKTTTCRALARRLTDSGLYAALWTSCETGQSRGPDLEGNLAAVLEAMRLKAEQSLPEELRPPAADAGLPPKSRLADLLDRWARACPRPLVLFLDEIDSLYDDTLISVLRQLRDGFPERPRFFPQSVILVGLRDVRDYKLEARPDSASLGSASPFNVSVESLTLANFSQAEIGELYVQHTAEQGQRFEPAAIERAFQLTRGQPWLVNALARQAVEVVAPNPRQTIGQAEIERAAAILIERRDTHLDSLIDRLREPRVQRVIAPMLAGDLVLGDRIDDDIAYVEDLGLVERRSGHLEIANEIYREVIPRALASVTQGTIYHQTAWYLDADGRLDLRKLLQGFVNFWREHGEPMLASQPYHEVAAQLVLMSFLQRILNGGGVLDREYAVGAGRMDLCLRWPAPTGWQREALELKVWRTGQSDPLAQGLDQLANYVLRLGLSHGVLVIFDQRSNASPIHQRGSFDDRKYNGLELVVLRL